MYKFLTAGAFAAMFGVTVPCAAQEAVAPISQSQFAAIATGEVVVETDSGAVHRGEVIGFLAFEPSDVTSTIRASGNHPQWFPADGDSRAAHTGSTHGRTNIPVLRDRFWRLNETHETVSYGEAECDVVTYEYDHTYEEGNMDVLHGYWLICPFNGGTALKYVVNADIGVAVPRALVSWAQNRMLPSIIDVVAERVGAADAE